MKVFISIALFIFTSPGYGFQVTCASPSGESLLFASSKDGAILAYENERGPELTPLEDGSITESSVEYYKMAFNALKDILGGFEIKWPANQCQINSQFWLSSCSGETAIASNPQSDIKVEALNLSLISEEGASGAQSLYRFRLSFIHDGDTYFVPLRFPKEFCHIDSDLF